MAEPEGKAYSTDVDLSGVVEAMRARLMESAEYG